MNHPYFQNTEPNPYIIFFFTKPKFLNKTSTETSIDPELYSFKTFEQEYHIF